MQALASLCDVILILQAITDQACHRICILAVHEEPDKTVLSGSARLGRLRCASSVYKSLPSHLDGAIECLIGLAEGIGLVTSCWSLSRNLRRMLGAPHSPHTAGRKQGRDWLVPPSYDKSASAKDRLHTSCSASARSSVVKTAPFSLALYPASFKRAAGCFCRRAYTCMASYVTDARNLCAASETSRILQEATT